jgi:hypothetical protein
MIALGVQGRTVQPLGWVGISGGALVLVVWIATLVIVGFLLEDFVTPIMYRRRCGCMEAWGEFRRVFSGHGGTLVLYFLFKMLLGFVVGLLALLVACLLCCLVVIPYIGTVIMLPFLVFNRSYSLYFWQQFHDDYHLLPLEPDYGEPVPLSRDAR